MQRVVCYCQGFCSEQVGYISFCLTGAVWWILCTLLQKIDSTGNFKSSQRWMDSSGCFSEQAEARVNEKFGDKSWVMVSLPWCLLWISSRESRIFIQDISFQKDFLPLYIENEEKMWGSFSSTLLHFKGKHKHNFFLFLGGTEGTERAQNSPEKSL